MADERVVVVTGVSGYWGRRAAARLLEFEDLHVIGLDQEPPQKGVDGLDFIQADLRNPLLVELLAEEQVDTILHLQFREAVTPSENLFDQNVMGTAKLLAAGAAAGIRQFVLKSSLMVYGARPDNPMFLREDHPHNGTKKYGYIRDWMEIEKYAQSFHEQNPDALLTVLRFGHVVGPRADSPMTRFLREEEAITLLGFDPLMQVIHEDDVIAALVHAVMGEYPGTFNVAPERGMPLWKTLGLAAKIPVPVLHPLAYWTVSLGGPRLAPLPLDYLRYPCMGDMRRMREVLQFTPQYTPEETVREFSSQQRVRKLLRKKNADALDEDRLRDTIRRRRRMRARENG
jgi:UDP-glucose 4-epimerase